ncbi:hypothetical protein XA68_10704 [Ophiocordyceps unilateralis]|uniref:SET domain-containing protein n=1 Tax=Ophiocordyceps unilateralis TaxID=268505 RepID=A0A2A9P2J9_OPHUN|nr:hypothetical protein XA68_10704 [Ophiocordyceps unilateralis]
MPSKLDSKKYILSNQRTSARAFLIRAISSVDLAFTMACSRTLEALLHPFSFPKNNQRHTESLFLSTSESSGDKLKHMKVTITPIRPGEVSKTYIGPDPDHSVEFMEPVAFSRRICRSWRGSGSSRRKLRVSWDNQKRASGYQSLPLQEVCGDLNSLGAPDYTLCVRKRSTEPRYENDFFRISRSQTAGWGAFAVRTLRHGDLILRERSLFVADQSSLFREFERLDSQSKQIALSLHANELAKPGTPPIQAIWATNCFTVGGQRAGLFPIAARFNHACYPAHNVRFHFDHESDCLVLHVRADEVAAGEELRISYGRDRTVAELYMTYGFRCRCGVCPGLSDKEVQRLTSQW